MDNGGFVFLSHSHQDIEKVRKIRNALEAEGYEPLCFFLKCLSDEDEIDGLIKREIDAREWFVFLNSPNSRASRWVTKEREYVSSLRGKQIVNIDLEDDSAPEYIAERLAKGLRIFIAYNEKDKDFANALKNALIERDYQVFLSNEGDSFGKDWKDGLKEENLELVKKSGAVVAVTDGNGNRSLTMKTGIEAAESQGVKVIEVKPGEGLGNLNSALVRIETYVTDNVTNLFKKAKSHNEVWQLQMNCDNPEEAEHLAEEAHDRLDEQDRIKDDILNAISRGTMKMTPELQKMLDEM